MPFLDPKKKCYKVEDYELPLRENVKGVEMKRLRELQKQALLTAKEDKYDPIKDLEFEIEWFNEISKVAFSKTFDELVEHMSEPDAKQLLGEAFAFLTKFGTTERLLQFENALAEISEKSKKLLGTTQNSSN